MSSEEEVCHSQLCPLHAALYAMENSLNVASSLRLQHLKTSWQRLRSQLPRSAPKVLNSVKYSPEPTSGRGPLWQDGRRSYFLGDPWIEFQGFLLGGTGAIGPISGEVQAQFRSLSKRHRRGNPFRWGRYPRSWRESSWRSGLFGAERDSIQ